VAEEILNDTEHPVILIDGECALCNHFARFVLRNDPSGRFRFAPQASAWARERGLTPASGNTEDSIRIWKGRHISSGSDAVLEIFSGLRYPWNLLAVLKILPRALREAVYSFVARNRYRWFGKVDCCGLLTPQEKARFLDTGAL
jgi:predicted DCC family thiol-disulfide oxidoreductase YuxK